MDGESQAERLVREGTAKAFIAGKRAAELAALPHQWSFWSREAQRAPDGDWRTWMILGGRGFGKTRAGAEWVRGIAEQRGSCRIALVGATEAEVRSVMVEGESGLLAIAPPDRFPKWEPSLGRLTWPNGARAMIYSAAEPDGLRGAQHHVAWADEVGKWKDGMAAWSNLDFGLRLGWRPRMLATTTPRPGELVRQLMHDAVVTRGTTAQGRSGLAETFLAAMTARYGGTRLGRQELDGELIEEVEGALWSRALMERCREDAAPEAVRVVIGVDPPVGAGEGSDACGIVAASLDAHDCGHVLEDATVQGLSPNGWAKAVAQAAARHGADRVVAEANNGGAMVESVLRIAEPGLPVKLVHAARGKGARAEPVQLLYERGLVRHAGVFRALEDQLCGMCADGYRGPGRSPDRADALVWALSELMLGVRAPPGLRML